MCETKFCSTCQKTKPISEFNKHKGNKDGLAYECRSCKHEYNKSFRENIKSNPYKLTSDGTPNWVYKLYRRILSTDKRYKIDSVRLITKDDIIEKFASQNGQCYYTGLVMDLENYNKPFSISVDRVDSELPYSKGNTVLCCLSANLGKNMFKADEYLEFITAIKRIQNEKKEDTKEQGGSNDANAHCDRPTT